MNLHRLDLVSQGVDLARLLAPARRLPALIKHDIPSQIAKAGRRLDLHPLPADFQAIKDRALVREAG